MNRNCWLLLGVVAGIGLAIPTMGYCSVESSLENVQSKLEVLLPVLATLGLGFAGVSFLLGSPNARGHLILAIIGAVVGFGATSIMGFIRQIVR
ncbi:hypothetical protein WDW37_20765 [Bdellovibrionota bacterium FG-1]